MCAPSAGVPGGASTSNQFLQQLQGYIGAQGDLLGAETTYKPGYLASSLGDLSGALYGTPAMAATPGTPASPGHAAVPGTPAQGAQPGLVENYLNLLPTLEGQDLASQTAARQTNTGTVSGLTPGTAAAVSNITPGQSPLVQALTGTATTQLAAGSRLDPNTVSQITQGVRSDWSNRGLGTSLPAGLDEAVQLEGAGQNVLNQRMSNAGAAQSAANAEQGTNYMSLVAPALNLAQTNGPVNAPGEAMNFLSGAGATGSAAGPTLINPGQTYDMFNTTYNANAAANIANANTQASLIGAGLGAGGRAMGGL